jgi:hypothetical protein
VQPAVARPGGSARAHFQQEIRPPPAWRVFVPDGRCLIVESPTNGQSMVPPYIPRPHPPRRRSVQIPPRRIAPLAPHRFHDVRPPQLPKKSATGLRPRTRSSFSCEFPSVSRGRSTGKMRREEYYCGQIARPKASLASSAMTGRTAYSFKFTFFETNNSKIAKENRQSQRHFHPRQAKTCRLLNILARIRHTWKSSIRAPACCRTRISAQRAVLRSPCQSSVISPRPRANVR